MFNGHHDVNLNNTGSPFTPDYRHLDDFLIGIENMTDNDKQDMLRNISLEEIDDVLKRCPNHKSPGLDGIPYEFYKAVWPIMNKDFMQILQVQLDSEKIIQSNKIGATRLIPKVKGVPTVEELRPITLLNTDYKILSKILVKRIRPVLPDIIKSGQLCSVGDKNILFGVNNILSSILYINSKKRKACLLSLDFFKAYDRVFLEYLIKVMNKMNFSPRFCQWILMLHEGAGTKFILEVLSRPIQVEFSIRQGDPLSMILYIIYIEPLLLYLERTLKGIKVAEISQTIEAYCDDVNVMTEHIEDLPRVDNAVQKFEAFSGAILSRGKKCKIMGFGSWKEKRNWPLDYLKVEKEIKVFGIIMVNSYRSIISKNWEYRFKNFQSSILSWGSRSLPSIYAKVEVLKMFAMTRIFYVASILPMTKTRIKQFEILIGKFVWDRSGWILRVSLNEIKNSLARGGLNLLCLKTMCDSLLLSQFLRLLKSSDIKSVSHVAFWICDTISDLVTVCISKLEHPPLMGQSMGPELKSKVFDFIH